MRSLVFRFWILWGVIWWWGISPGVAAGLPFKEFTLGKDDRFRVGFQGSNLRVQALPRAGEGEFILAERLFAKGSRQVAQFRKANQNRPIRENQWVTVPFKLLEGALQGKILRVLFPEDQAKPEGWEHRVSYPGETLSWVAGVFLKNQISANQLAELNRLPRGGRNLSAGHKLLIPWEWLRTELELQPVAVKAPLQVLQDSSGKRYAYYQLQKGEAIYSSVVIRFTGRILNDEVNDLTQKLMELNQIRDPKQIAMEKKIKIPLEWLSEEFLADATPEKKPVKPVLPRQKEIFVQKTSPVHVVLDPGHGGYDPGATFGKPGKEGVIFEDELVYDIMLRMKDLMEARGFVVHPTRVDPSIKGPQERLSAKKDDDELLLVTPPYRLVNTNVGVNLRVYLVNSIYQRLLKQGVPQQNIVLMSIHGDALHESLRGAMVYFPDPRLRLKEFRLHDSVYQARKEFREQIRFVSQENETAAELSEAFGKTIIETLGKAGLATHTTSPVRAYYYRGGKRTLPAILRYSKIPTSVLVEVANLNNPHDRKEALQAGHRQKIAAALVKSFHVHLSRMENERLAAK